MSKRTPYVNGATRSLPAAQTCMNCHTKIRKDSPLIEPLWRSWISGRPVRWVKVHNLANYVYFNHSAHVSHGVGCVECHGRIDRMDVVAQQYPLSMGWCLECHRKPETRLRPRSEITNMDWKPPTDRAAFLELKRTYRIHDTPYMMSCSTCHR